MKPLTLLIKPAAGLCNLNCRYCFYRSTGKNRDNRIMTAETVDMLIQRINRYEPSALSVIFQGGEPTLAGLDYYKYFVSSVKEELRIPVSFSLQTNGILVDGDYAQFFKENDFLIGISLDGDKKTNDRYRLDFNGESVFSKTLDAVNILNKYKVDFNVLSVIDNENAKDIESTYAFFKKCGFYYLQFIPFVDGENDIMLSAEKYELFLKKIFDLWYEDFMKGDYISIRHIDNYINILMGKPPENCAMCGVCGNYFVVESNGDIYPCDFYCKDEYRLGSVYDENPFELNKKHKDFIDQSFLIRERCKMCKYGFLCRGGCKRDRTDNYTSNRYCRAYKGFFDYSFERMQEIAHMLQNA